MWPRWMVARWGAVRSPEQLDRVERAAEAATPEVLGAERLVHAVLRGRRGADSGVVGAGAECAEASGGLATDSRACGGAGGNGCGRGAVCRDVLSGAAGRTEVGETEGFGKRNMRYVEHGQRKQVLVQPLFRGAESWLNEPFDAPVLGA